MIVEARGNHPRAFDDTLLTEAGVPVFFWPRGRMKELDGVFDVLVCQTVFTHIEAIQKSKIAMVQYGLAKEPHNYGDWRAFADLCLVYGPYSAERIAPLCPVKQVGHPRFDGFFEPGRREAARRKLGLEGETRPTLLYVPTWGDLSTQDQFLDAVLALSDEYTVLLKLHHNTTLVERGRRARVEARHVQYFGANDDLVELLAASDVVLSDYSGAIFDALLARKPVVLLQSESESRFGEKLDEDSLEYAARHRIGPVIDDPDALRGAIAEIVRDPSRFAEENDALVRELYVEGGSAVRRSAAALRALADGKGPKVQKRHLTMRKRVRAERRASIRAKVVALDQRKPLERLWARFRKRVRQLVKRPSLKARFKRYVERLPIKRLATRVRDAFGPRAAQRFLRFMSRAAPQRAGTWKLDLETRQGWFDDGRETLAVLLSSGSSLMPHLAPIQRLSAFYPELRGELATARRAIRAQNLRRAFGSPASFVAAVKKAIEGRWIGDARALVNFGRRVGFTVPKNVTKRLVAIERSLGPLRKLVAPAQANEDSGPILQCFRGGKPIAIAEDELPLDTTVEIFLPTPFFAFDETEKAIYGVVRENLRSFYEALLSREDLTIVPRLQFNWRHAVPRTRAWAVSYHTRGDYEPKRIHVQESTLFGHCSFDHQGYAGFAAHVDRPELVEEAARGVPLETLEQNFAELKTRYVVEGISKYAQSAEVFECDGPYVFVALQVTTDEVAQLAFVDMLSLLEAVARSYAGSGTKVVVKRHPYCTSPKVADTLARLEAEGLAIISNASIHSLIRGAERVYTVNSGVGLESLLHEKPVVVSGKCEYMYATTVLRDLPEDLRTLDAPFQRDRVLALFWYLRSRLWVAPLEAITARAAAPVD